MTPIEFVFKRALNHKQHAAVIRGDYSYTADVWSICDMSKGRFAEREADTRVADFPRLWVSRSKS